MPWKEPGPLSRCASGGRTGGSGQNGPEHAGAGGHTSCLSFKENSCQACKKTKKKQKNQKKLACFLKISINLVSRIE